MGCDVFDRLQSLPHGQGVTTPRFTGGVGASTKYHVQRVCLFQPLLRHKAQGGGGNPLPGAGSKSFAELWTTHLAQATSSVHTRS